MNSPVLTYRRIAPTSHAFADLARVRLIRAARTDGGVDVPAGTMGTVVGVWAEGVAYEVEVETGLATVDAAGLAPA